MANKIQTKLTPGTYRLLDDLPALRKDKRRNDWRYKPMKAGTRFFYTEWTYSPSDDDRKVIECRLYPVGDYSHDSVSPNESSQTRDLEELLVRVEETPSLWMRREHESGTALGALDQLLIAGKITMEDVQAAADAHIVSLGG